jgi:competence protein ComEA
MARDPSNLAVTVTGVAVLIVIGGIAWFGLGADVSEPSFAEAAPVQGLESTAMRVHVSGAVASPGVVELHSGSIVADAVSAAGGALRDADLASINLAAPVRPGERIVVPSSQIGASGASLPVDSGVDLNAASRSELEELPGVGPVLAKRIVAHRIERGPFLTVEDLLDVPGIGEAKLAQMRDSISHP